LAGAVDQVRAAIAAGTVLASVAVTSQARWIACGFRAGAVDQSVGAVAAGAVRATSFAGQARRIARLAGAVDQVRAAIAAGTVLASVAVTSQARWIACGFRAGTIDQSVGTIAASAVGATSFTGQARRIARLAGAVDQVRAAIAAGTVLAAAAVASQARWIACGFRAGTIDQSVGTIAASAVGATSFTGQAR